VIQRFWFVKLRDAEVGRRDLIARRLGAELVAAGASAVVGVPADASAARWDLSIVIEVESLAAWRALEARADLAAVLASLEAAAEVMKAWTFAAIDEAAAIQAAAIDDAAE
jgi:hypothetical protein